jgi:hypothetical protein
MLSKRYINTLIFSDPASLHSARFYFFVPLQCYAGIGIYSDILIFSFSLYTYV